MFLGCKSRVVLGAGKKPQVWWDFFISLAVDPQFNGVFLDVFSSSPTQSWWSDLETFHSRCSSLRTTWWFRRYLLEDWCARVLVLQDWRIHQKKGALREKVDAPCFRPRFKMPLFWTERGSQIPKIPITMECTKPSHKKRKQRRNKGFKSN